MELAQDVSSGGFNFNGVEISRSVVLRISLNAVLFVQSPRGTEENH
jgi:hypothetical protein